MFKVARRTKKQRTESNGQNSTVSVGISLQLLLSVLQCLPKLLLLLRLFYQVVFLEILKFTACICNEIVL